MEKIEVSSGVLKKISEASQMQIDRLCANRQLIPINDDQEGQGNHRAFSFLDVVAVTYGLKWKKAGASWTWVGKIISFLIKLGLPKLEKELQAGNTYIVPFVTGKTYLINPVNAFPGKSELVSDFDLKKCYEEVKEKLQSIITK